MYSSPTTYGQSSCYKGAVVDVSRYMERAGTGGKAGTGGSTGNPPPVPGDIGTTRVSWSDVIPTTQAPCESLWLSAYLFEGQSVPGSWTTQTVSGATGQWDGSSCIAPFVDFGPTELLTNNSYRIAASARPQPTTGAPTRALQIRTRYE